MTHLNITAESFVEVAALWNLTVCVYLAFLLKFSNLQGPQTETFFDELFREKKTLANWQLFFFGSTPEIFIAYVSRPLLALRLGEYWFRISCFVYDRNRPLATILRQQRQCSLMYDVYLTCLDNDVETGTSHTTGTGSKYLGYNPGSELIVFSWTNNNEQWKEQKNWVKQKSNKRWTKDE
jgi:hypothetical protein